MSTLYPRGGVFYVGFPDQTGRWHKRTTKTRDRSLARAMGRMVEDLGLRGKQEWDLLAALRDGRLDIPTLYTAYSSNDLGGLRKRLDDTDLSPMVDDWLRSIEGRVAADTKDHYEVHVRSLITEGNAFPRSELTFERLSKWLSDLPHSGGTKRKYHAAMSSFCQYLRSRRVIESNPMRDVKPPSPAPPRDLYLEHGQVIKLVDSQAEPYRTISAILHGSGGDLSALIAVERRDIDTKAGTIRLRGTKPAYRDRTVHVEPWAMDYLRRYVKRKRLLPGAPVFPGVTRWAASKMHGEACEAIGLDDYQLRDARHTYAVRAVRAGAPLEIVARQLGHRDTTMVARVYARYKPSSDEIRRFHELAAAKDKERAAR